MNFKIFKIRLKAPYHLNPGKDSLEKTDMNIQSDMFISALAIAHKKLYGIFPEEFFDNEVLLISSLFPFYNDVLFLPSPLFGIFNKNFDIEERKKYKKVRYLEKSIWEKVINGRKLNNDEIEIMGELAFSKENVSEIDSFFTVEDIQRLGHDPFSFSQVRIIDKGGFYFLVKFGKNDKEVFKRFVASVRFLGDEGIGSDKTVGKGFFELQEINEFKIENPNEGTHFISLSFFIPAKSDLEKIDLKKSYYYLQHKKGWYVTYKFLNLRKRGIYGFKEGSVFCANTTLEGKVVTLLKKEEAYNDFDVLRNGYFFGIPIRVPEVTNE